MTDAFHLVEHYRSLSNAELLDLAGQSGFTPEAKRALEQELGARNLGENDIKKHQSALERRRLQQEIMPRGGGSRGLGIQFFGRGFLNDADKLNDIEVRTRWLTIGGIPLIPLGSYRFRADCNASVSSQASLQRNVIARVPLYWPQICSTAARTALMLIAGVACIAILCWLTEALTH